MSDSHIRPRRRQFEPVLPKSYIDIEEEEKKRALQANYNPFSTVFNVSATQLWNSAQEALAPCYDENTFANLSAQPIDSTTNQLDNLSIFGSPYDSIDITMPSRDRTSEFRVTAKSFEMRMQSNSPRSTTKHELVQETVQFNQLAKRIGRDLSLTCAKMEKLAEYAKKRSAIDERSEIEHLSAIVKEDITGLNKQIAALQEFSRQRNGAVKSQNSGHSQLVVVGLQSKLACVSKDFQNVIEVSTENMKTEKNRREKFSMQAPVPMGLPSSSSGATVRSRLLQDDDQYGGGPTGSVSLDMGMAGNFQQQMVYQDQSLEYAQSRSNTMATIEGSISELGQIFSQLATLVSEQGEMITRIDSNVEETSLNIDMAHSELVKYLHNISKNRWLMIQVFGVLMVFFIVFVMFLT